MQLGTSLFLATMAAALVTPAMAQDRPDRPFVLSIDGLYASQGDADLEDGGSFSVNRAFARAGGIYRFGDRVSAGLFVSRGEISYEFGGGAIAPWSDVNDLAVSVPIRVQVGDDMTVFVSPSLRYDYEDGASQSSGETFGAFLGASWQINERLMLGPAFGVFSQIEDDSTNVFPALLIDWDITERLNLSTGPTIGATQGPGLALSFAASDSVSVGLAGRYENIRFRLDDDGPAPGGVGEDESFPLVATFSYAPNPGFGISAFAGAELGGRLRLEDTTGTVIETQDYDPAPVFGAAIRLAF